MKSKKTIVVLVTVILVIGLVIWFGCNFAPGSYPYAEEYELSYSEEKVKSAITKFKEKHPEYRVPKVTINHKDTTDLADGQSNEPNGIYSVYFYYKDEDKILFTWIRPSGNEKTTLALVSINNGLDIGNWKDINKDFGSSENKGEKQKFEERILNDIKKELQ